jgi:surfactin family lipopeptide synthetase A
MASEAGAANPLEGSEGARWLARAPDHFGRTGIERSITACFEDRAASHRDRVAVEDRSGAWSYCELNWCANRVAREIRARLGDGGEAVAVLSSPGAPTIAAMLGTLKAGKVCVPLDPRFPATRLREMVEDSRSGLVVTDGRDTRLVRDVAGADRHVVEVGVGSSGRGEENPDHRVAPDAIAFITTLRARPAGRRGSPTAIATGCTTSWSIRGHSASVRPIA